MSAYKAALGATERKVPKAASLDALVTLYLSSGRYRGLAPITRSNYRNTLDRFRTTYGELSVAGFQGHHARTLIDELEPNPAYSLWRVLRLLFKFAADQKWRPDDPMAVIHAPRRPKTAGYRTATADDVARFRAHFALGTKPRLAFELLFNTAARRSDAVGLGRQHCSGGFLTYTQGKTGAELAIEINADLQAAIDAMPKTQMTFLVTEYGAPFTAQGFTNWFKAKCAEAGLPPNTSPHSLRKGMLTHLANNGATTRQIMAVSGHQTLAEVERYTRKADQKRLASGAMSTISERPVPKPGAGVGKTGRKA
jgi:site-specific recombinase XerD